MKAKHDGDVVTFSFGENWREFIAKNFDQERLLIAQEAMLSFLEVSHLRGKTFLDVGCGSGLHSLAAFDAGAERVVSFDVDPSSVDATRTLRALRRNPPNWTVLEGSVLHASFLATLEPADVVYAWGSLHHTGSMWEAVENTAGLVKPGGLLFLSLYTTSPKTPEWIEQKKRYNRSSRAVKLAMEGWIALRHGVLPALARGRNPLRDIAEYKRARGMSYWTDLRDWLGGWPYEDATPEEVLRFSRKRLSMTLANLRTGTANTEYLLLSPPVPARPALEAQPAEPVAATIESMIKNQG